MSGFIAKVARLSASKAAAFGYAVAVGVAGNIAFHYVEPPAPPPAAASVASSPAPADAATTPATSATSGTSATRAVPAVAARHEPKTAAPPRPTEPHRVAASAPVLPEPPATVELPRTDALLSPVLRPVTLPREAATPASAPPPAHRAAAPEVENAAAVSSSPAAATAAPATLPPLGPAIEVDAPPMPPSADAPPAPALSSATARSKEPPSTKPIPAALPPTEPKSGLEISDLWHPGRAVRQGLHWAGRQVPLIGDDDGDGKPLPHPAMAAPEAAVSAPIPLLPDAGETAAAGRADAAPPVRKPSAPGPGSGGLY